MGLGEWRFDGQVVAITGAGGNPGIGRAAALYLAARGARLVINDVARLPEALGYDQPPDAAAVVAEIRAAGGEAVACVASVAEPGGGRAVVECALDHYGRLDAVVNNAGLCPVVSFAEMTPADFRHTLEVNLFGAVRVCRAAWPHLGALGGRIVNVGSGSMAGYAWQSAYAAAKGALFSFTRVLAVEGRERGVRANLLLPAALTRMVYAVQEPDSPFIAQARGRLTPEGVAPVAAFLAHAAVPFSGECLEVRGRRVARWYWARTPGAEDDWDPERLASRWPEIAAGAASGEVRSDEVDPRRWHPRPYRPFTPDSGGED
ncbi:MAG: putative short-chain dehydrogenase/reductase [Porticoccaceae bacterium]|nr:MAG: putative short-chain dehydrogenase/reductase [Porticoccaceae bacterium]